MEEMDVTRVIGLISGTSVDGIDAALIEVSGLELDLQVRLLNGTTYPYPEGLRAQILEVCGGAPISMAELAALDDAIAQTFAEAALTVQQGHPPATLIGSHGQTVFHRPCEARTDCQEAKGLPTLGYSLQLGRGALMAQLTGITTVSNFRVADIAVGGQGAPLVSRVDACLLGHPTQNRCVQNLGGIGNVTYLPARDGAVWTEGVVGWDTGPGNVLLDLAAAHLSAGRLSYDQDGAWAASGTPCSALVEQWLQQDFFQQPPPKSTGRELFDRAYLHRCLAEANVFNLSPADILATLTELTATSVVHSYRHYLPQMPDQVLLCGGGSRNLYLKNRIQIHCDSIPVLTTDELSLSSALKEAIAFAILAYWRQQGITGNLPQVTGARQSVLLGEIHLAPQSWRDSMKFHPG